MVVLPNLMVDGSIETGKGMGGKDEEPPVVPALTRQSWGSPNAAEASDVMGITGWPGWNTLPGRRPANG